jgi:ribonuclease HI
LIDGHPKTVVIDDRVLAPSQVTGQGQMIVPAQLRGTWCGPGSCWHGTRKAMRRRAQSRPADVEVFTQRSFPFPENLTFLLKQLISKELNRLSMAEKYYVVWSGRQTGVFTDWAAARRAVERYAGARYKSFATRAEAEQAFRAGVAANTPPKTSSKQRPHTSASERRAAHIAHQFDVTIYCDGACEPNPGNAGSGIVVYRAGTLAELWYGLYNPMGTNNTAELTALYHALRMAEAEIKNGNTVEVCSDSAYSINCIRLWAPGWEKRGWKKAGGEIKNLKIIQDCYAIYQRIKEGVKLTHVAAHIGTEGNELADRMAMLGAQRKEKELRLYQQTLDIPTLLKMRPG